jgi:two-component system, OmpR family, copper resistance phosphate regulon response regulator CusR
MEETTILIVEDEQRLSKVLKRQFESEGFRAEVAHDGYLGKQMIEKNAYNLIILDINIPLINGYDLCKEIRKSNKNIPIIMLTALGTPDNKVTGFDAGADDYVLKPFDFRELLARVHVFLKRSDRTFQTEKLSIADLEMDLNAKTVTRSRKRIELTAKEYALLKTFLTNKGKVLSRDYLIENVWGIDFDPGTNVIDVYVNYLRKKIDKEFSPKLIHTKFGFGFYCNEIEI